VCVALLSLSLSLPSFGGKKNSLAEKKNSEVFSFFQQGTGAEPMWAPVNKDTHWYLVKTYLQLK
jgi:hypothetical protein